MCRACPSGGLLRRLDARCIGQPGEQLVGQRLMALADAPFGLYWAIGLRWAIASLKSAAYGTRVSKTARPYCSRSSVS